MQCRAFLVNHLFEAVEIKMQSSLSTPSVIIITVCLLFCGMLLTITPIRAVKLLMLWPVFLRKALKINFSPKNDEILLLLDKNPSAYQVKYKAQTDIFRITGAIALCIGFALLWGLFQRFN
jgi:hypothetical protein